MNVWPSIICRRFTCTFYLDAQQRETASRCYFLCMQPSLERGTRCRTETSASAGIRNSSYFATITSHERHSAI